MSLPVTLSFSDTGCLRLTTRPRARRRQERWKDPCQDLHPGMKVNLSEPRFETPFEWEVANLPCFTEPRPSAPEDIEIDCGSRVCHFGPRAFREELAEDEVAQWHNRVAAESQTRLSHELDLIASDECFQIP
jgi:hypothetical protein